MKNNRDMFYENAGYFTNPNMGMPMVPNQNMPMTPNPNMQMGGYPQPQQSPSNVNIGIIPNNNYETLEQKVNRLERFCKRLDNRVSKLESTYMTPTPYKDQDNNDMYMI